jgi:tetratricopeptide (TPR) repeat protein
VTALTALRNAAGRPGGSGTAELVVGLHVLADAHLAQVDLDAATAVLDEALDLLSDTLVRRGTAARMQADVTLARRDLELALATATSDAARAGAHNALGILEKDEGHHDLAAAHYAAALKLGERVFGSESLSLAPVLHNLAGLAYAQHRFPESEHYVRRAIDLRLSHGVQGDQAGLLGDVGVLAAVLARHDGSRATAEHIFRSLVGDWSRLYGPDHYEVACCRDHLGVLLRRRGAVAEAAEEFREAIRIKRRVLGQEHPETAALRQELARCATTLMGPC